MVEHVFDVRDPGGTDGAADVRSWDGWETVFGRCVPADVAGWVPVGIPTWLDDLEPGPVLSEMLSSLRYETLSPAERVVVLRARRRLISHHEAAFSADMTAIADGYDDPDPAFQQEGGDPSHPHRPPRTHLGSTIRCWSLRSKLRS